MASQFDLTPRMSEFFNEHGLIEVLKDLRAKKVYPDAAIKEELVKLIEDRTELIPLLQEVSGKDFSDRNRAACEKVDNLTRGLERLLNAIEQDQIPEGQVQQGGGQQQQTTLTFQHMDEKHGLTRGEIEGLYDWAVANFQFGNYSRAITGFNVYLWLLQKVILPEHQRESGGESSKDDYLPKEGRFSILNVKWGLLAACLGDKNYDQSAQILLQIEEFLEHCSVSAPSSSSQALNNLLGLGGQLQDALNSPFGAYAPLLSKSEILVQRTWLMHWALFILFKGTPGNAAAAAAAAAAASQEGDEEEGGAVRATTTTPSTNVVMHKNWDRLLDTFISEAYLALVSLKIPHMLRYIAALFIRERRLKSLTKDLIHVLAQDRETYSDSLTEFLLALYQDLDFDTAKLKLKETQALLETDFFLSSNAEAIMNNARLGVFQIYCRTHQSVDIATIADKMTLPVEECETYIVGLIQNGRLTGACIDSVNSGTGGKKSASVFFPKTKPDVSEQVLEKTKNMAFRLSLLQANATITGQEKKHSLKLGQLSAAMAQHLS